MIQFYNGGLPECFFYFCYFILFMYGIVGQLLVLLRRSKLYKY